MTQNTRMLMFRKKSSSIEVMTIGSLMIFTAMLGSGFTVVMASRYPVDDIYILYNIFIMMLAATHQPPCPRSCSRRTVTEQIESRRSIDTTELTTCIPASDRLSTTLTTA